MTIQPGCAFETHILDVVKFVHDRQHRTPNEERDYRPEFRTLLGVEDLAATILSVREHPSFPALLPHLRLLSSGSALQTTPSSAIDQATDKLFELLAGCVAMQCGEWVELDDPVRPTGTNPDVLVTISGRRWGIACKVLHSLHPGGFINHLDKGLDQIEVSEADTGMVFFNLKNVIDHDAVWPYARDEQTSVEGPVVWHDSREPFRILLSQLDDLGQSLLDHVPDGYLDRTFKDRKSIPGFLLWAHSVTAVRVPNGSAVAGIRVPNFRRLRPISSDATAVLACLHRALASKANAT